jgi:hypothetical protein
MFGLRLTLLEEKMNYETNDWMNVIIKNQLIHVQCIIMELPNGIQGGTIVVVLQFNFIKRKEYWNA